MQLHPAGDALVVPRGEKHLIFCRRVGDGLSRRAVPDSRVRNADDLFSRQKPMFPLNLPDLCEYLLGRPFQALVGFSRAAVEFQNAVGYPIPIHRPPAAGEGPVISPVKAAVNRPVLRDLEGIDDMGKVPVAVMAGVVPEFLKELPLVYIPAAVEPGLPQLGRQLFQGAQVFRLLFQQGPVVRAEGLDEGVVLRVFLVRIISVDEQPFEVPVGRAAGVQGIVGTLGKPVHAPDAGIDLGQPAFLELPRLVGEPHVIFRALVLPQIRVRRAVPEGNGTAVWEPEELVRAPVLGDPSEELPQGCDVIVKQFFVGSSGNEYLDARIVQAQQHSLPPDEPAFPAAPGPAVAHIAVPFPQGKQLLFIGPGHNQHFIRHIPGSPLPALRGCSAVPVPGPAPAGAWRSAPPAPGYPPQAAGSAHP
uniref:Uncharacterized protein n=1 Tax=Podoviridae sp. ctgFL11 TaxID=2827744 RepID=A0A8S5SWM3_9CAUD|nr:MAG TPA: hypothetical protein [Podoviridae sp. ctgFL11]